MTDDAALRISNETLAHKILHDFNRNMEGWFDHFHEDLVVEFAFAASIDIPARVVGKAANTALFKAIVEDVRVKFYDIQPQSLYDPAKVVVEYKGIGGTADAPYQQKYICMQEYRDSKLIGFREYFDTWIIRKSFSNLDSLNV